MDKAKEQSRPRKTNKITGAINSPQALVLQREKKKGKEEELKANSERNEKEL